MNKNIVKVKIIKDELWKRIVRNPFKYYARMCGFTFCFVSLSNIFTAFVDKDRFKLLKEHPQIFFTGLLFKSIQFGLIWPAYYITMISNPKAAFYIGAGIEEKINNL